MKPFTHDRKHDVCPDCHCYDREGKQCSICGVNFPVTNFRVKVDGYLQSCCLGCESEYMKTKQREYSVRRKEEKAELIKLRATVAELQNKLNNKHQESNP